MCAFLQQFRILLQFHFSFLGCCCFFVPLLFSVPIVFGDFENLAISLIRFLLKHHNYQLLVPL